MKYGYGSILIELRFLIFKLCKIVGCPRREGNLYKK
jgi:hypothetical protein